LLGLKLKIAFSVQYSCGKKVKTLFGRKAAPHRPHGKNRPHRTACFFFHAVPTANTEKEATPLVSREVPNLNNSI
jgi:hypothetical protein